MKRLQKISAGALIGVVAAAPAALASETQGVSSSATPYVKTTGMGLDVISILTVGDSVNTKPDGVTPYRMVGIPDGLGAYDNGDGTFTLLMNHELGATAGVTRAHGQAGAFVSEWKVDKSSLQVLSGADLVTNVNNATGTDAMARLCSADLPAPSAFYDAASGLGTTERIFMNGEEAGNEGRAFGHVATGANKGQSYELPALGKLSWENSVANPGAGAKTVVIGTDDSTPGQVYMYVGDKLAAGNEVQKAGLTNGNLYGLKIPGVPTETRAGGVGAPAAISAYSFGNVSGLTGAALQAASVSNGVTEFLRPEDAAWDPTNANRLYFVTTDQFDQVAAGTGAATGSPRLWSITFNDVTDPTAGGTIQMLLDGSEVVDGKGVQMFDNIAVDKHGNVLIQEDPGGQDYLARVYAYNPGQDKLFAIGQHDAARFAPGGAAFLTRDEEASGIIDASDLLGDGWALLDVQAHYSLGGELVEGGQLLAIHYDVANVPEPGTAVLLVAGLAGLIAARRRTA